MSDYVEQLRRLQPLQIEGRCLESLDQWPARHRCVFRECQFPSLSIHAEQLSELRFENCSFGEMVIEGGGLERIVFDRCKVQGLHASGGLLSNVAWHQCDLGPWVTTRAKLKDIQIFNCQLHDLEFVDVIGRSISVVESKLNALRLSGGNWRDLTFATTYADHFEVKNAHLERILLGRCHIELASFSDCIAQTLTCYDSHLSVLQMSQVQASGMSWQDSVIAGGRLDRCSSPAAVLANCKIQGLHMTSCEMQQAILDGACLVDCDLRGLRARHISMRRTKLQDVDLTEADLLGLNATDAVVSGLRLRGANCCDGILHGQREADWDGADLDASEFKVDPRMDDSMWCSATRTGPREGAFA